MDFRRFFQNEWVKLVLVTVVSTVASTYVTFTIERSLPDDPRVEQAAQKDALLIDLAKQLTGRADEATVERVKTQVVTYLTDKLNSEYVTWEAVKCRDKYLADYVQTNMTDLVAKIDALREFAERGQDPDLRYRRLLQQMMTKYKGQISIHSDAGWELMCGFLRIIKDDKTGKAPHVAEALAQSAIRLGNVGDESRARLQKEMILFSVGYLERYAFMLPEWYVYKAMSLLFYDAENFEGFVRGRAMAHKEFEKEFKDSHFLNESFFESTMWPLRNNQPK